MRILTISAIILMSLIADAARSAEIVLVYPRTTDSTKTFTYDSRIDSTFVLGRIEPPSAHLSVNGILVNCSARGAFLAWLPLRKNSPDTAWELSLTSHDSEVARLRFPYSVKSTGAALGPDSFSTVRFPRIVRVLKKDAHTTTVSHGSYDLFPPIGCELLSVGHEGGAFQFSFGNGIWGEIEDQFVGLEADSTLPPARLGNGVCERDSSGSGCSFLVNRIVPWRAELSADAKVLTVILLGTSLCTDRIRYDVQDDFVDGISQSQEPNGVTLAVRLSRPALRGFGVQCTDNRLTIRFREPFVRRSNKLKGKVIVLDPGHGGNSTGAIGPLGTREKDVTLALAQMLSTELEHRGAIVRLTRTEDTDLGLYERVEFAQRQSPDFCLSLHCNAAPDSQNPLLRHGSGTYYHQSLSRYAAEAVHQRLLQATGLRDDGLYDADFAVIRPTEYPSVLVETAYLIYPPEEELLQSNVFLRRLSHELALAVDDYFGKEH
jgi:N-acetylmuramoyl-L-alanine amidase